VKIEGYLTTSEVAERLNVSVSRVKNLIKLDRLHPVKLGKVNLFKSDEVENFTRLEVGRPRKEKEELKGVKR
jgi:excisionase family DNA binding protein